MDPTRHHIRGESTMPAELKQHSSGRVRIPLASMSRPSTESTAHYFADKRHYVNLAMQVLPDESALPPLSAMVTPARASQLSSIAARFVSHMQWARHAHMLVSLQLSSGRP
jgi:hypothetical protein